MKAGTKISLTVTCNAYDTSCSCTLTIGHDSAKFVVSTHSDPVQTLLDTKVSLDGAAFCSVGDKLYVFGTGATGASFSFDVATKEWKPIPDMPDPAQFVGCAAIGTNIYVVGGLVNLAARATARMYDTITGQWSVLPSMAIPRAPILLASNGTIWAFAGDHPTWTSVEAYTPGELSWTTKADLPAPGIQRAVSGVISGETAWLFESEWMSHLSHYLNSEAYSYRLSDGATASLPYSIGFTSISRSASPPS